MDVIRAALFAAKTQSFHLEREIPSSSEANLYLAAQNAICDLYTSAHNAAAASVLLSQAAFGNALMVYLRPAKFPIINLGWPLSARPFNSPFELYLNGEPGTGSGPVQHL